MHPYSALPATSYWRKSVSGRQPAEIDPVGDCGFRIWPDAKVATAGSCFAQRISKHLQSSGYNYFRTESAPPEDAENPSYGLFSAAYGNIYTTTQLRQLMLRAYGLFEPRMKVWRTETGSFIDPFRPTLKEGGYATAEEVLELQEHHLACVRQLFEEADVFVFTLGLTETWLGEDGGAIPLVPAAIGAAEYGDFYTFANLSAARVSADLLAFFDDLRRVNRNVHVIVTVSPVAMIATYEKRHVVQSNMYSKSVLRVAAQELVQARGDHVHYFPLLRDDRRTSGTGSIPRARSARHHFGGSRSRDVELQPALHAADGDGCARASGKPSVGGGSPQPKRRRSPLPHLRWTLRHRQPRLLWSDCLKNTRPYRQLSVTKRGWSLHDEAI